MSYAYAQPHNIKLDNLTDSEFVENGTVASTASMIYIRSPSAQRAAIDVYSKEEIIANTVQKTGAVMSGTLDMDGQTIANVATAQNPGDAVPLSQLETYLPLSGESPMAGDIDMGSNRIRNLASVPLYPDEVVRKDYVDALAMGVAPHRSVIAVLYQGDYTYYNGLQGTGLNATLTATSTGVMFIDGIRANIGDRVMVNFPSEQQVNGIYVVTTTGGEQLYGVLTRENDQNGLPIGELNPGALFYIQGGNTFGFTSFSQTTPTPTIIGTSIVNYTQFSAPPLIVGGTYLPVNGTLAMLDNLNMGHKKIINVAAPTALTDAMTKGAADANYLSRDSKYAMTANLNAGGYNIANVGAPVNAKDACNLEFSNATYIRADGTSFPLANINLNNNKLTNVAPPTNARDAVNLAFVQQTYLPLAGGNLSGDINTGTRRIYNLPAPVSDTDAVNRVYVSANYLHADGSLPATGSVNMGGNRIQNLADPVDLTDAANVQYNEARYVHKSGDTLTGTLNLAGNKLTGLPLPISATDAVSKTYVDSLAAGLTTYPAVAAYTQTVGIYTYVSGVITCANNTNYLTVIDGYTLAVGDRVLFNVPAPQSINGVYTLVSDTINGTTTFARVNTAVEANIASLHPGALYYVENGTVYAGSLFVQISDIPTELGVSPVEYSRFSSPQNLVGDANIDAHGNLIKLQSNLTGLASVQLADPADAGTITLSKQVGTSIYNIALPAEPPSANNVLAFDGTKFIWTKSVAGTATTSAPSYLYANNNANVEYSVGQMVQFADNTVSSLLNYDIVRKSSSTFTLAPNKTYRCVANLTNVSGADNVVWQWWKFADANAPAEAIGNAGGRYVTGRHGNAVAYIVAGSVSITVGLKITFANDPITVGGNVDYGQNYGPWMAIDMVDGAIDGGYTANLNYFYTTNDANVVYSTGDTVFLSDSDMCTGGATDIMRASPTSFTLAAGRTFRCIANITQITGSTKVVWQWWKSGQGITAAFIGQAGGRSITGLEGRAVAYITVGANPVTVSLKIVYTASPVTICGNADYEQGYGPWALIEAIGGQSVGSSVRNLHYIFCSHNANMMYTSGQMVQFADGLLTSANNTDILWQNGTTVTLAAEKTYKCVAQLTYVVGNNVLWQWSKYADSASEQRYLGTAGGRDVTGTEGMAVAYVTVGSSPINIGLKITYAAGNVVIGGNVDYGMGYGPWFSIEVVTGVMSGTATGSYLSQDGSVIMGANLNINNYRLVNVAAPVDGKDAVNLTYVGENYLNIDGTLAMAGNLDMSGNLIKNVAAPLAGGDAVNLAYAAATYLPKSGSMLASTMDANNNRIANVLTPVTAGDAVNLGYAGTTYLPKSGAVLAGPLNANGNAVTNVVAPTNPGDAVNLAYAGDTYLPKTGAVLAGDLNVNSFAIHNLVNPLVPGDAVNLAYSAATYLPKTGAVLAGNMDANSKSITNVAAPVASGDAVNLSYSAATYLPKTGAVLAGNMDANSKSITNVAAPVASGDAVNLSYSAATYLPKTGAVLAGNMDANSKSITNVAAPVASGDAVNLAYSAATYLPKTGAVLAGVLNVNGNAITNVATPVNPADAVCKSYVDSVAAGLTAYPAVAAYTTSNMTLTYNNGTSGAGATLASSATSFMVDGYAVQTGDRVLFNAPTRQYANGVYVLTTQSPLTLTRALDLDGSPNIEIHPGALFYVLNGAVYGGAMFVQTSAIPVAVGTSAITFTQFAAPLVLVAGTNINVNANQISLAPALAGITSVGLQASTGDGTVTLGKAAGAASYSLTLPAAAPSAGNVLTCTGADAYSWSSPQTLVAGANVGISGSTVAVSSNLTNLQSLQISGASAADAVTVTKSTGGAAYALALPAAAPSAGNVLTCTGAGAYSWSSPQTLVAGANVGISGSTVAVSSNLTNLQSLQISGASAADAVTVTKSTGGAAYPIALPAAAPAANTCLSYDGTKYNWSPAGSNLSAGTNISISGSTVSVAPTLTNVSSMQLVGSSGADVLSIVKNPGSSYQLALPSAAPAANTCLTFDGTNYNWLPGGGSGGVTATQYLMVQNNVVGTIPFNSGTMFPFNYTSASAGSAVTFLAPSQFVLQAGYSYKCTACLVELSSGETIYSWYNVTNGALIGSSGNLQNGVSRNILAIGYITPTVTTTLSVISLQSATVNSSDNLNRFPWATIEVVGSSTAIVQFSGANSTTAGAAGYVPPPPINGQDMFLRGDGTWAGGYSGAPVSANFLMMTNDVGTPEPTINGLPLLFPTLIMSQGIAIKPNGAGSMFTLMPGNIYKCTASGSYANGTNVEAIYRWYNNTTGIYFGAAGECITQSASGNARAPTAIGVINPQVTTVISCNMTNATNTSVGTEGSTGFYRNPWVTIEVIANQTAIAQFAAPTTTLPGTSGYIPAPPANGANLFLRGDGTWAGSGSGTPSGAQYCMMLITQAANASIIVNTNIRFDFMQESSGLSFTMPANTFMIQPPYRYKLSAQLPGGSSDTRISWYNVTTGAYIGAPATSTGGWASSVAVAYITCTVATTIALRCFNGGNTEAVMTNANVSSYGWATIEVVSDNTAISAFSGATSIAAGMLGYIPAPQPGDQNSYLRGDGKWVQANNAPTAANYLHVYNSNAAGKTYGIGVAIEFPSVFINASSGIIGYSAPYSNFVLQVGYTYKLTAGMAYMTGSLSLYQWYVVTGSQVGPIGNGGDGSLVAGGPCSNAIAYIMPTVVTSVSLYPVQGTISFTSTGNNGTGQCTWATIEIISNNNTITAFVGAKQDTNGVVGYIPAPPAGSQNLFLRGDGTWAGGYENAPVAAQYCMMFITQAANAVITANTNITFDSQPAALRSGLIFTMPANTFVLQPPYSYKLSAQLPGGNSMYLSWYNLTTGAYIGTPSISMSNWASSVAVAYITATVATTVALRCSASSGFSQTVITNANISAYGWATMEVISNNSAITAFTGATAIKDGTVGYIPAPGIGAQNSYLRGDGTWQQANNAPTSAVFLHMMYYATTSGNVPTTTGQPFPFNTTAGAAGITGVITLVGSPITTAFTLASGYTYKCTAAMGFNLLNSDFVYQWRNNTTGVAFGIAGDMNNGSPRGNMAIGYIANTGASAITISLNVNLNGGSANINVGQMEGNGLFPWCTIEVVSNNNTITAFGGATAAIQATQTTPYVPPVAGTIGYVPAPPSGAAGLFLRGDGTWAGGYANAPSAGQYLHVTHTAVQTVSASQAIAFNTTLPSSPGSLTQPTSTTFVLPANSTYKCTGCANYTSGGLQVQWYNATTATYIGIGGYTGAAGNDGPVATAYVTTGGSAVTVSLYGYQGSTTIQGSTNSTNPNMGPWAIIELVSSGNSVLALTGATQLTAGAAGYVPMPLAGQQNTFLRGDGTWANVLGTNVSAEFYYVSVTTYSQQTTDQPIIFNASTAISSGSSIVQISGTQFQLAAGKTYKCAASLAMIDGSNASALFWWYDVTMGNKLGRTGEMCNGGNVSNLAVCYIVVGATSRIITLMSSNANTTMFGPVGDAANRGPWATIEVVANNSAITQFTGALTTAAGTQGFVPAPPVNGQNLFLRGDGTWAGGYSTAPVAAQYYYSYALQQTTTSSPWSIVWPTSGNIGANTTTAILQKNSTTFTLAPGNTYRIMAGVGRSLCQNTDGHPYYITANGTKIGNQGEMIPTTQAGNWASSPTCVAYIQPAILTNISFVAEGPIGQVIGHTQASAWIAIEVIGAASAISVFGGANAATNTGGTIGYIPAPPAGGQNMFLRGDGQWAGAAPTTPVAAMYLMVTNNADVTVTAPAMIPFLNTVTTTNSILQPTTTTFSLSAGITYKCTANIGYSTPMINYIWYNNTLAATFGQGGSHNAPGELYTSAIGYITPLVTTTISLKSISNVGVSVTIMGNTDISTRGCWATIEAVSNNNTITAFTGAKNDNVTGGTLGYIPAPPPGAQNMFLRGDGTWAGGYANSPSAGQFYFTATVSDQSTGTTPTYLIQYPMSGYSVVGSNATAVTQPNSTTFVLQAGYSYKCSAGVTYVTDFGTAANFIQFYSTGGAAYGVPGTMLAVTSTDSTNNPACNSTAIAYITPTTNVSINVRFTNRSNASNTLTGLVSTLLANAGITQASGGTWVSIEVIGNNNTVTAFTGAGSDGTTPGALGYIPAPLAGQQNAFLCGNGQWVQPSPATPTAANYYYIVSGADQVANVSPYTIKYTATSIPVMASGGITHPTATTFVLPVGGTYKCTAGISLAGMPDSNGRLIQFYNNTTASSVGNSCMLTPVTNGGNYASAGPAIAYIIASVETTISVVYAQSGSAISTNIYGSVSAVNGGLSTGAWVTIEQINNTAAITAFGAANTTSAGLSGYVPAPPVGGQGMFLRGDGTWAGSAPATPTAAEYIHVTSYNNISATTNTVVPLPNLLAGTSSKIQQPTATTFQLTANCSYKCTGVISVVAMRVIYQWYNVTTSTLIGVAGCNSNTIHENAGPATVIILPTVQTTISLMVTYVSQSGTIYGQTQLDQYQRGPWALIELLSNGTAITQFTGASSTTPGASGFVPPPLNGQQGAFLRGDGTWANSLSTPISAEFYYVGTTIANNTAPNTSLLFASATAVSSGSSITQISGSQFQLATGRTYKCTATAPTNGVVYYGWYDESMGVYVGAGGQTGDSNVMNMAVCYITTTATTKVVSIRVTSGTQAVYGSGVDTQRRGPWCTIEVVANNSAITQFVGATQNTGGVQGFMPAPQAGQQNTFLCANGTWTGALSAPTVAQYAYAKQTAANTVYNTGNFYKFGMPAQISGSSIVQLSETQFQLQPNQTYKCTADLNCTDAAIYYQWYNVTMSAVYGTTGWANLTRSPTAFGYITPTVSTVISLYIIAASNVTVYGTLLNANGHGPWCTIEAVNNGAAVTQFAGASSTSDGVQGYVPQPNAGQQSCYLRGDGTWSKYMGSQAEYLMVKLSSDLLNVATGTDIIYATTAQQIGTTITYNSATGVFTLPAGRTYELSAMTYCTSFSNATAGILNLTWVDSTNTPLPTAVKSDIVPITNTTALSLMPQSYAIITTTTAVTCKVRCISATGTANISATDSYVMIKLLADSTAITAMVGASAASSGNAGFMPAPQAGEQNYFLRGDGKWAGYAGTAVEQIVLTRTAGISQFGTYGTNVAYDTMPYNSGSSITFNNTTGVITLPAGCTFDLFGVTRASNFSNTTNGTITLAWVYSSNYNAIPGGTQAVLVPGSSVNYDMAVVEATLNITTTAVTTVCLRVIASSSTATFDYVTSYARIKMVANGTAVAQIVGATASTNGVQGFMPAPQAGQQNMFLRGDGQWAGVPLSVNEKMIVACVANASFGTTGTAFPYNTVDYVSGGTIIFTAATGMFTLVAGNQYELYASTWATNYTNTAAGSITLTWADGTGTPLPGAIPAVIAPKTNTATNATAESIAVITPGATMQVQLLVTANTGTATLDSNTCYAKVTLVSSVPSVSAVTGATASSAGVTGLVPTPAAGQQGSFLRGDGTWASAAPVNPNTVAYRGILSSVVVVNVGTMYITPPAITISVPPAGGVQATAVATVSAGSITTITLVNAGAGYTADPTVTISAPASGGVQASAIAYAMVSGLQSPNGSGYLNGTSCGNAFIMADGSVRVVGASGNDGRIATGNDNINFALPVPAIWAETNWIAPMAVKTWGAYNNIYVLGSDGYLYASGLNGGGQLGIGNTTTMYTLTRVNLPIGTIKFATSQGFANCNTCMALLGNGQLYGWGWNGHGQLGLGDTTNRSTPTRLTMMVGSVATFIDTLYTVVSMNIAGADTSGANSFILLSNGQVLAAGLNSYGVCGNGNGSQVNTFGWVYATYPMVTGRFGYAGPSTPLSAPTYQGSGASSLTSSVSGAVPTIRALIAGTYSVNIASMHNYNVGGYPVVSINKNGVSVASYTFPTSGNIASLSASITLAINDAITITTSSNVNVDTFTVSSVGILTGITQVVTNGAGNFATAYFLQGGTNKIYATGRNDNGQYGNGTTNTGSYATATLPFANPILSLTATGSRLNGWGTTGSAFALTSAGLYAWGFNRSGYTIMSGTTATTTTLQLNSPTLIWPMLNGPTGTIQKVIAHAAQVDVNNPDYCGIAVLLTDGRIYYTGINTFGCGGIGNQSVTNTWQRSMLHRRDIVDITFTGDLNNANLNVLTSTGEVYMAGLNIQGQCGNGTISNRGVFGKTIF